ncbi:MAG: OmpA family protein [Bacteroidota bacterium]
MHRTNSLILLLALIALYAPVSGQKLLWQKAIGSSGYDNGMKMIPVDRNCFLMGGQTSSNEGFGEGNHSLGIYDLVVARVSAEGQVIWQTLIGGSGKETFSDMQATPDGGAVLIGTTESKDGDATSTHGKMDYLVAKVDRMGNLEWSRCYGGTGNDKGLSIIALENGHYIIGGESGSRNGTMTYSRGGLDAWVAMLDPLGDIILEKSFGGTGNEKITRLFEIKKERYLALCTTNSANGDVKDPLGAKDVWAVCLSKNFDIIWQRTFGGTDFDEAHGIVRAQNGDLVIAGTTFSEDEDLSLATYHGLGDSWMFQITYDGNLRWSQTYGGAKSEGGNSVAPTPDGGYIMVGTTNSRAKIINKGLYDGWMVRTDSLGRQIWAGTFGGEDFENLYDVMALEGGNYLALGFAESVRGDLAPLQKDIGNDFWFIRFTDPDDPIDNALRNVPYLAGTVKSETSEMPIPAEVTVTENRTLKQFSRTRNEAQKGMYTLDLPEKGGTYSVMFSSPGYMFYGQDLDFDLLKISPEIRIDVALQPILVGSKVVLNNINFDIGKAEIRDDSEPELRRLERFLKANPDVKVEISGHTDNTGVADRVKSLSERRATRVRDWLLKAGVAGRQMQVAGYGMEHPIASNETEEGRQKNRRVEVEVVELL